MAEISQEQRMRPLGKALRKKWPGGKQVARVFELLQKVPRTFSN
jgi:hypothetical protein